MPDRLTLWQRAESDEFPALDDSAVRLWTDADREPPILLGGSYMAGKGAVVQMIRDLEAARLRAKRAARRTAK